LPIHTEADNRGLSDSDQLAFATSQRRALLTFNVKDFVSLAQRYSIIGKHHSGIIVSDHLSFRDLLRRILVLLNQTQDDITDQLLWLQDFKKPNNP